MTAAGLHELTALRQQLAAMRYRLHRQQEQLDAVFTLVSRMEDAALNTEGLFAGGFSSETQELESAGRDRHDRDRAG